MPDAAVADTEKERGKMWKFLTAKKTWIAVAAGATMFGAILRELIVRFSN